jgi:hypothetical protein
LSARTDVRARSSTPGDLSQPVTFDIELLPLASLQLDWDTTRLFMQYYPSILFSEPHKLGPVSVLNRVRLSLTERWHRATLTLMEDAVYGESDISALRPAEGALPGTIGDLHTVGVVPYARSATTALVEAALTQRLSLSVTAGYQISGNPNDLGASSGGAGGGTGTGGGTGMGGGTGTGGGTVAATDLPLQYGPYGTARLRYRATRRHAFSTLLQVNQAHFTTGQDQLLAILTENWEGLLTRQVQATIGLGAAWARERLIDMMGGPPAGVYGEVLPVALGSLRMRARGRETPVDVSLTVRLAPFADRFTGEVFERFEPRLQIDLHPYKTLLLMAATGAAVAVPLYGADPRGDKMVFGEGSLAWNPFTYLTLAFLFRVLWIEQPRLGIPGQIQWLSLLSVTPREQDSAGW